MVTVTGTVQRKNHFKNFRMIAYRKTSFIIMGTKSQTKNKTEFSDQYKYLNILKKSVQK